MRLAIIYGSTTGNTADAADAIAEHLADLEPTCLDVEGIDLRRLTEFDVVLVGVPTWDVGGVQDSWDYKLSKAGALDVSGVRFAFFGHGDQEGYPQNFQDALGIVRDDLLARGGTAELGHWPTEGYEFEESKGLLSAERFVGLALDNHNQCELTRERILAWCEQLRGELSAVSRAR